MFQAKDRDDAYIIFSSSYVHVFWREVRLSFIDAIPN